MARNGMRAYCPLPTYHKSALPVSDALNQPSVDPIKRADVKIPLAWKNCIWSKYKAELIWRTLWKVKRNEQILQRS